MSFDQEETEKKYSIRLVEEDRAGVRTWFAEHPKLPGCHAIAATDTEALRRLSEVRAIWLDWAEEVGYPVPEADESYNMTVVFAVQPKSAPAVKSDSEAEVQEVALVA